MNQLTRKITLQKCWIWNGTVIDFVKSRISGYSLNVCAGMNPICSVNLDLDPKDRSIIKGDMRVLPFDAGTFDTVISDPPWKISYYERRRPFFECIRVCKVGGRVIYNATWIPSSTDAELVVRDGLEEIYVRQDNEFSTTSIISIFRKTKDNPEYEAKIDRERNKKKV
jgi:ubiquinone/menaquinone biosynthesis C-methylase UbiE